MTAEALAIDGGKPVRTAPFPPWPHFEDDEIRAVEKVLRSGRVNYWTGEEGRAFEDEFARFVGTPHAVSTANGTVALEAALQALGIGAGDEVVVPCRTFFATASAVVMRGATPIVADVDGESQNLTADTLRAALTSKTRAVIPVHLAGWPCDMDAILAVAREKNLKVVEDCAQALGSSYKGKPVGSFGDAAAFSFCQDKILTTLGEGGMVTTRDRGVWERVWAYRDHGKSHAAVHRTDHPTGFRWLIESFGTNGRLTEVQSAAGRVSLNKVPGWVARRGRLADRLAEGLRKFPVLAVPRPGKDVVHANYKFSVHVDASKLREGWSRDRVHDAIRAEGVPVIIGFCPEIHREKAFEGPLRPARPFPNARALGESTIMIPLHPTMADGDADDVVRAIGKVLGAASK